MTGTGHSILVDDEDYEFLNQYIWRIKKGNKQIRYANRLIKKQEGRSSTISIHREIMRPSEGEIVDHIDGNGLNNQKENLRICNKQENSFNMKGWSKESEYKGIYLRKKLNKWAAQIGYNYKRIHIGLFNTKEEAAMAYNKKAIELYGEYAKLNILT